MFLSLISFPPKLSIIDFDFAGLQFLITEINAIAIGFGILEEVVDSGQTGIGIGHLHDSHDEHTHWVGHQVEQAQGCVDVGSLQLVRSVNSHKHTEDQNRGQDGHHVHEDFDVAPQHKAAEVELELLFPDALDLIGDDRLPPIVLDDSDAAKVFVDAFASLISPEELVLSECKGLLHELLLEEHSHQEYDWRAKADIAHFDNGQRYRDYDHEGRRKQKSRHLDEKLEGLGVNIDVVHYRSSLQVLPRSRRQPKHLEVDLTG